MTSGAQRIDPNAGPPPARATMLDNNDTRRNDTCIFATEGPTSRRLEIGIVPRLVRQQLPLPIVADTRVGRIEVIHRCWNVATTAATTKR